MKRLLIFLLPSLALAVCPVCIAGVGIGLGLSRYLGIDDLITGLWLGALVLSLFFWTIDWLDKRNIRFHYREILILLAYYLFLLLPLYSTNILSQKLEFLIKDKLFRGIILGSLIFYLSILFDKFLRTKNNNKVFFPFQRVIIPLSFLIFSSLVVYLVIK
ncbi:hypothetical protein HRbin35_00558 [bacterium HR35]|nr:hypothetical protein HRbin35_00558 [bacterium HR35]